MPNKIKYQDLKHKYIKIKYKNSYKSKIVKGLCISNPLTPTLKGSGCIIIHNLGLVINEIRTSINKRYYYTSYVPLYMIDEIYLIEKDTISSIYLAWIGKIKNTPIDILLNINKFMKGWNYEIKVEDFQKYNH